MSTLGGNDQFTTMGQVTDILYIVIMKNRENILCIPCYTYLKKQAFLFKTCNIMCRYVEN